MMRAKKRAQLEALGWDLDDARAERPAALSTDDLFPIGEALSYLEIETSTDRDTFRDELRTILSGRARR